MSERPQVLIADDESNLRRVLSAQLSRDGFEVVAVEDGQAAIDALEEHHLDVVITDLRMPKVDGMGVLKRAVRDYLKQAPYPVKHRRRRRGEGGDGATVVNIEFKDD